jgi:hypothetical protein
MPGNDLQGRQALGGLRITSRPGTGLAWEMATARTIA